MGVHIYVRARTHTHTHTHTHELCIILCPCLTKAQGCGPDRSLPVSECIVFCTLFFCNIFSISNIDSFLETSSPSRSERVTSPSFPHGPLNKTYGNPYFKVIIIICLSASLISTCWLTPGGQRIWCAWPMSACIERYLSHLMCLSCC